MFEIEILKQWKLYYYKCTRFDGWKLNWDNNPEFTGADALGIAHTILMLPIRALLKLLDLLQPVAKYFKIDCNAGFSMEWMFASGLLWLFVIAALVQFLGTKHVRK